MHLLYYSLAFALPVLAANGDDTKHPHVPCTIRSPTSGAFFDLNPVHVQLPAEGTKPSKDARLESWHARGYDYGTNFTLNFCGPVVEELKDVVGVHESYWKNVSAYYEMGGKIYSIGSQNSEPVFRGRKLVLNYTDGSPCPSVPVSSFAHNLETLHRRKIIDDDDDDDDNERKPKSPYNDEDPDDDEVEPPAKKPLDSIPRRKNTIISLLCTNEPLAPEMAVSFVASPDSCTYIFEARSPAACGGVEKSTQQLGPTGVFGVIALIAVLVYVAGGCVYQRTVMHQRGWRQLPNYGLWAGIFGFFSDIIIILTSSCAGFLPSRRGYNRVGNGIGSGGANGVRGRGRQNSEDENRLIDQLDEEWDD